MRASARLRDSLDPTGTRLIRDSGEVDLVGALEVTAPIIGMPRHMATNGAFMWLYDRVGEPYFHLIDLSHHRIAVSYGRSGEGPGDFASVASLQVRPGDTSGVWAYDPQLRRLTQLTPNRNRVRGRTITVSGGRRPYDLLWLDRDRLLGINDLDTNRFQVFDTSGNLLRTMSGPLLGSDSMPWQVRRGLSSAFVACVDPAGGRFAVLFVGAGRIDIHDTSGALVRHADVPFVSDGEFHRDRDGRYSFGTRWRYYADCAATTRYLYALFAGYRTDVPGASRDVAATHVQVFDWNGALRGEYHLDRPMGNIAVVGDTLLYAASMITPGVYRYRLPVRDGR